MGGKGNENVSAMGRAIKMVNLGQKALAGLGLVAVIGGCAPKIDIVEIAETEESCSPTKKTYAVTTLEVHQVYLAGMLPIPGTSNVLQTNVKEYDCKRFRFRGMFGHRLVKESLIAYDGKVTIVKDGAFTVTDLNTGKPLEYKIVEGRK